VAGVKSAHPEIPAELRQLAQSLLDRIDPAIRMAAAVATGRGDGPGKCQQVWCPVCALVALVQGEQHPMLDIVAEHSVALMTVVRALVDADGAPSPTDGSPNGSPNGSGPPPPPTRYQHIPITLDDN
jgi:hypothetical protein